MTKHLILSAVLFLAFVSPAKPADSTPPFEDFQKAAGDSLYKSDASVVTTSEALNGKRHLVVFFSASWCGPCGLVVDELKRIYAANEGGKTWEVILVSTDKSKSEMFRHMSSHAMPWLAAEYDATAHLPKLRKHYTGDESGIPNFVILDSQGSVLLKASDLLPQGKTHQECLEELRKIVSETKSK